MIKIPDLPGLQGSAINAPDARQADQRLGPALAVNAAIGGPLADAIGGIGAQFQGIAEKAQQMENARQESEARMQLDSGYAQLQIELEKDPDPVSRIEKTKQFFESNRGMADNPNLSPQVRDSLRQHYTEFAHKGTIQATAGAAKLSQQRSHYQLSNEIDAAVKSGRMDAAKDAVARGIAAGVLLPEQGEAAILKAEDAIRLQQDQRDIIEDPAQWLEDNPPDKIKAGYDPVQYQQQQAFAKGQLRTRSYEASSDIQDGIVTGKITTPEQIDQLAPDLRPTVREELKNGLLARTAEGYKETIATPEFQAQTYGKISAAIANYNPDDPNADLHLAQIDNAMRNLKPGFIRDKVEKQFKELGVNGQLAESKSYGEFVLKQVDELNKVGRFGKVPEIDKIKTADLVKDGFLKDPAKLQRLGFSESQAADITEAATEDPAMGQGKLSELWTKRDAGNVKADEFEIAAANALRLGHATVNYDDPDSAAAVAPVQLETARKYGIAKMKMEEFLRLNPEATNEKIDAEFLKVTGEGIRAEAKAKFIAPKPARGGYVPGETSMNLPPELSSEKAIFEAEGLKHGIDPRLLAAISMHETANGKSSAYRNKNNAMGVSNSSGPISFEETSASIAKMARLLGSTTSGPYKNARTIAELGKIYAPVGAENDPGSLNSGWAAGVAKYFKQLGGNPLAMIK